MRGPPAVDRSVFETVKSMSDRPVWLTICKFPGSKRGVPATPDFKAVLEGNCGGDEH